MRIHRSKTLGTYSSKKKSKRQSGDFVLPTEVIVGETPGAIPAVETELITTSPLFYAAAAGIILALALVLFVLISFCVLLFKKCRSTKDCSVKQENSSLDTDQRSPKSYTPSLQSSSKERLKSVPKNAKQEDSSCKKTSPPLPPPVFLVKRDESQEVRKIKSTGSHMSKGSTMSSGTPRSLIGSKHKQSIKGKGPALGTSITLTTVPRSAYGGPAGATSLLGTVNLNNNTSSLRPLNYALPVSQTEKKMKDKSTTSFASAKSSNTTESSSKPMSGTGGVSASLKKEVKADPVTTEKPNVQETVKNTPKV